MTRDEAVKIWLEFGSKRVSDINVRRFPVHIVQQMMFANAEDCIDGMIRLGILKVDQPSPQDTEGTRHE